MTWIKGRRIKAEQKVNRRPRLARAKWTWVTHTQSINRISVDEMKMRGDSVEIDDREIG